MLRCLPRVLRASGFRVTCVVSADDLLIDVEPGDTTGRLHAIASIRTTTVVATLLDLATGTPVAVRSMLNRQQPSAPT